MKPYTVYIVYVCVYLCIKVAFLSSRGVYCVCVSEGTVYLRSRRSKQIIYFPNIKMIKTYVLLYEILQKLLASCLRIFCLSSY